MKFLNENAPGAHFNGASTFDTIKFNMLRYFDLFSQ